MNDVISESWTTREKLLVGLNAFPLDATYRTAIGLALVPIVSRVTKKNASGGMLALVLFVVLLLLRIVPLFIRKLVPFPKRVQAVWSERRQLAKQHDSYQWQKLLWIGLGLSGYIVYSNEFAPSRLVMAGVCLTIGSFGLAQWRDRVREHRAMFVQQGRVTRRDRND